MTPPRLTRPGQSAPQFTPPQHERTMGLVWMVALHLVIGYALLTGLAQRGVNALQKPLMAVIVPEPVAPPPPPPPPLETPKQLQPVPQPTQPPPAYVPPPEIAPPAVFEPGPTITSVQVAEPVTTPAPLAKPTPAPVAPPPPLVPAAPAKRDVAVACPNYAQILQAGLDGWYDKVGIAATVKVQFKVQGNAVQDATVLSGPREYHRAVLAAVRKFSCKALPGDEPIVVFDIVFRSE